MKDLQQILQNNCYGKPLEQRKQWYSPAAVAYQQARPSYPQPLIDQVVKIAQISSTSRLLEIGCGPAIATLPFARVGCEMECLEPNPEFAQLAQQACQAYPKVTIQNQAFEEWALEPGQFDGVLAASSFHWIPPEIACPKAAAALRPEGALILLWNKELQPSDTHYQQLSTVYDEFAPALNRPYEDVATQVAILNELGQLAMASGQFRDLVSGHVETAVTYSIERYLCLLKTYSPYLQLEAQHQQNLFAGLRQVLAETGDTVELSYVSAYQIARPLK
jgi:SAM-dependent methyltransferase